MNCGVAMTVRLAASRVVSDYPQRLPHLFMAKLVSKIPTAIHATRTRFSRAPTSTSLHGTVVVGDALGLDVTRLVQVALDETFPTSERGDGFTNS